MPIITIFGATGCQGSAVVNSVLADGNYTPRAVSRNPESPAAKELRARGVEVVAGNLFDKESLKEAMRGSSAVFGVTNFWDPEIYPADLKGSGEILQGQNLVDAAKAVGVKFFIWSSLPNATKESKGLFPNVYHLDNKAVIEEYLKSSGIPHAILLTGWFGESLWRWNYLKQTSSGYNIPVATFTANTTQAFTWVGHDLGAATVALLTHHTDPSKGVLGSAYPVISFVCTYAEVAAAIAKEIGKEVTFTTLETEGVEELDVMYAYLSKFGFYADTPVPNPDLVALGVKFGSLEEFVRSEIVPRFA
ncbi:NAD(P)-binding protein [Mycena metata]|uniref:NAD(P)-binding protein n=1 Tax=Mycena metata TaxID=1033252 RepID=A0AAD7IXS6_9AGAR|nr:NAD(P)-binding protein [Mycena metata]